MTTDRDNSQYPGVHYFCIDVETSSLRTWEGQLLSIGIVVLDGVGNMVDSLYERARVDGLHDSWFNEALPTRTETQAWWREQDDFVKDEAYRDKRLKRLHPARIAHKVRNLALTYGETNRERIRVASPSTFDCMWVDDLLRIAGVTDPFYYHAVDMWSLYHGEHAGARKGENKGQFELEWRNPSCESDIPHHALADAWALAKDFGEYLRNDLIDLDTPHYEGYDEYLAEQAVLNGELDYEEVEPLLDVEVEYEEAGESES